MLLHHHHHHGGRYGGGQQSLPSLPIASEANADLILLDPAEIQLRREGSRLQMFREVDDDEEMEKADGTIEGMEAAADALTAANADAGPNADAAADVQTTDSAALAADTPVAADALTAANADAAEDADPAEDAEGDETATDALGTHEEWRDVSLVRLFPLTLPDSWISILDGDGKEVGVLQELRGLDNENLALVQDELRRRYLVPQIESILAIKPRFDLMQWTVDTDRGRRAFLTRNLRDQVQRPSPKHITMTDVEGNRYDIVDVDELDVSSRRRLDEQL